MTRCASAVVAERLTKRYGDLIAVDEVSFALEPAAVTGFLGPNGAGKTTTLRMLLDLVTPTSGRALVFGRRYHELERPAYRVGAVLEASDFHPGRSGRDHLRALALAMELPGARVDETLELVELESAARRPVRGYSLGMRQRLSLAGALLGDPDLLVLDEPANGLDPEGVRWLRALLRRFAQQGKTVLVSSHILAEVEQTVDRVLIIDRGRLVADRQVEALANERSNRVRVCSPSRDALARVLAAAGIGASSVDGDWLVITGAPSSRIGELAASAGIVVHELRTETTRLEDVFLELTGRER